MTSIAIESDRDADNLSCRKLMVLWKSGNEHEEMLLRAFKEALTRVGASTPDSLLHRIQMVLNYMKLGRWMARRGFGVPSRRVRDRTEVFDVVAKNVRDRDVLYLEFGVFEGQSMRYWSNALKNPKARLHGFDSFEGLPEDFDVEGPHVKGTFDVGGRIPKIDDSRITFHKGWFDQTVPKFTPPDHDVMVLCMDADLFSSTKVVLDSLRPWIRKGTYIYFDDMSRPEHEPRAFDEFMRTTGLQFRLVVAEQSLNTAFFVCLGSGRPA